MPHAGSYSPPRLQLTIPRGRGTPGRHRQLIGNVHDRQCLLAFKSTRGNGLPRSCVFLEFRHGQLAALRASAASNPRAMLTVSDRAPEQTSKATRVAPASAACSFDKCFDNCCGTEFAAIWRTCAFHRLCIKQLLRTTLTLASVIPWCGWCGCGGGAGMHWRPLNTIITTKKLQANGAMGGE